jgi:predicted SprT family Zn-dependent metalloprotease
MLTKGKQLLKRHNLQNYKLGVSTSKTAYAWCDHDKNAIEFSAYFLGSKNTESKHILETLLHEIAHGNTEFISKTYHDKHWKSIHKKYLDIYKLKKTNIVFMDETNSKYILTCENGCKYVEQRICPRYLLYCKPHTLPITIEKNY